MGALVSSTGDVADHDEMCSKFPFVNKALARNINLYTDYMPAADENPFCGKA